MKKWHIAAMILIALLAGLGIVLMFIGMNGDAKPVASEIIVEPDLEMAKREIKEQENQDLEEMLTAFAEVIYTYDTRERLFYEGAQSFMTEEGYQMLMPFSAGEEIDKEEPLPAAVISSLKEVSFYYRSSDKDNAQVMMEANFTLSRSGNGTILQYTKLSLKETENGWKIDGYETVDTIER